MNAKNKSILWIAVSGILAVSIGAFGAHGLKPQLTEYQLDIFNTGVQYHFYHTLAAAFTFLLLQHRRQKLLKFAIWAFIAGIVLFSGSLYLLATREVIGLTTYKWLGPLTPIGGLFFILGWAMIAISAVKSTKSNT